MRMLLVFAFGAVLLLALGLPATYFVLARDLPPLQGREQIVHTIAVTIESQRQKELAAIDPRRVQRFAALGPTDISRSLRAGVLATAGCPDYDSLPKEDGAAWMARIVGFGAGMGEGSPGPGRCELFFASSIAAAIGLPSDPHRAVAIHALHTSLSKEELLDLELSARYFAPGVLGIGAASQLLLGKAPRTLTIAETAELLLGGFDWTEIATCRGPLVLKQKRNAIIDQMAAFNGISAAEAERAKGERLRCISHPG
jgi:membrane peptidoglycan carboxypeptidase